MRKLAPVVYSNDRLIVKKDYNSFFAKYLAAIDEEDKKFEAIAAFDAAKDVL